MFAAGIDSNHRRLMRFEPRFKIRPFSVCCLLLAAFCLPRPAAAQANPQQGRIQSVIKPV